MQASLNQEAHQIIHHLILHYMICVYYIEKMFFRLSIWFQKSIKIDSAQVQIIGYDKNSQCFVLL